MYYTQRVLILHFQRFFILNLFAYLCNQKPKPLIMKKVLATALSSLILLSGCGTYASQGAQTGAGFGSILGSAIGGISGGHRGSDIGTIVGMAGGAVVGAAVGGAADKAQQRKYEDYKRQRQQEAANQPADESGFDPNNSGDDRIVFDEPGNENQLPASTVAPETLTPNSISVEQLSKVMPGYNIKYNSEIEVRNATFIDNDGDGILKAGEESKVAFEIMNRSDRPLHNVMPTVVETTGNKRIHISPSIVVEKIMPNRGVRYTATVVGDRKLKDGEISIKVAVAQDNNEITSQIKEFKITTKRK